MDHFALLAPTSYSRRVLDADEAATLLAASALAAGAAGVAWPLFVPVHDALRDAYHGMAQVGGGAWGVACAVGARAWEFEPPRVG